MSNLNAQLVHAALAGMVTSMLSGPRARQQGNSGVSAVACIIRSETFIDICKANAM